MNCGMLEGFLMTFMAHLHFSLLPCETDTLEMLLSPGNPATLSP